MPRSKQTSAYPSQYLDLLNKVHAEGKCIIPHNNPAAFRLNLYGYLAALRHEGKDEFANLVKIQIQKDPSALILILRDEDEDAKFISAALGTSPVIPSKIDETEAAINRILSGFPQPKTLDF